MEQTFWQTLATDLDFGPDGKLYVSDWVQGWVGENKGRIYTYSDPAVRETKPVKNVRTLLDGKIPGFSNKVLGQLLAHRDRRVRMEAQFELVDRKNEDVFRNGLRNIEFQRSALHCLWGLAQLQRMTGQPLSEETHQTVLDLLANNQSEIRAQAVRFLGEVGLPAATAEVIKCCSDDNLRVRYFAAMTLAKIGDKNCLNTICKLLIDNNDQDPIVRHGGIMALRGIAGRFDDGVPWLLSLKTHPQYSVRIAAVVALRKLASPEIGAFLSDPDVRVVTEAARAIYDVPIKSAFKELADLIESTTFPDPLVRRVINANIHCRSSAESSSTERAEALAKFAATESADKSRRVEALKLLSNWSKPSPLDGVLGDWRPIAELPAEDAIRAIQNNLDNLLAGTDEVGAAAIEAVGQLGISGAGKRLEQVVMNSKQSDLTRSVALKALGKLKDERLGETIDRLNTEFASLPTSLASSFLDEIVNLDPDRAAALATQILGDKRTDRTHLKQRAIALLEKTGAAGEPLMKQLVGQLIAGNLDPNLRLDVELVAAKTKVDSLRKQFNKYQSDINRAKDPIGKYSTSLFGGDAEAGRKLFYGKTELSCVRCHQVNQVGGEVGPNLSIVGKEKDRKYLLESIVVPNRTVADGYAQLVIRTIDGEQITGIVKSQNDVELQLMDSDGKLKTVLKEDIEEQKTGKSSMPEDLITKLSKAELRDLIAYLTTLKTVQDRPNDVQGPDNHK